MSQPDWLGPEVASVILNFAAWVSQISYHMAAGGAVWVCEGVGVGVISWRGRRILHIRETLDP